MTERAPQESRTNDDPAWQGTTPPKTQPLPASTEVAVVGAGLAGSLIAAGLAHSGARVVLLDPLERAHSVSRRSAGLVHQGLGEHPCRLLSSLGSERASALFGLFRRSIERLGPWASRAEQVWLASISQELLLLDESVAALVSLGLDAARLGPEGLAERGLSGEAGFRVAGDALVHPERTWRALLGEAVQAGATLTRTRARAVSDDLDGLRIATDAGDLRAEVVIFACGAAARALDPAFEETLWPVRESAASFPGPLPPLSGRAGHGWSWFRPGVDGEGCLAGGCRWASPHLEVGETDPVVVQAVQERIAAFAGRHLGQTGPAGRRWAWIEAHSCDGLPLVGPLPGTTRRIACTGFGSNDWGLAPACAELVVEGLVSETAPRGAWLSPTRML